MQPGNIKNHYFEKNLLSMVLNLTVYVRNVISIMSKNTGEIPIFRTWFEKFNFGLYFTENLRQFGQNHYDIIVMSYMGCLYFCWYVWKEGTHSYTMVPNKPISTPQVFIFQVHRVATPVLHHHHHHPPTPA